MALTRLLDKYTKQLKNWIEPLLVEERPILGTDRCSISVANKSIAMVHINTSQGTIEVLGTDNTSFTDIDDLSLILTKYVQKNTLQQTPAYWLLSPDEYQLFVIDSLPVAKEEFQNALKWRIRGLINFPIEETVVDYFKLPPKKANVDNMVAAIVTKAKNLTVMIDIYKKCGLNLTAIDIPELAMRNLSALYEEDEKSTAFLYFTPQTVILNITMQKTLYFTRRLNFVTDKEPSAKDYEQLCLEILRYFDYYQTQWRHAPPTRVFVASDYINSTELSKCLSEYLLQPVQSLQLQKIMGKAETLQLLEQKNLLTLGCALRKDNNYAAARN